jgi:hypothetical protein
MADEQDIDISVVVKDAAVRDGTQRVTAAVRQMTQEVAAENRRTSEAVQRMAREVNDSLGSAGTGFRSLGATVTRELGATNKSAADAKSMIASMVAETNAKLDAGGEGWRRYAASSAQSSGVVGQHLGTMRTMFAGFAGSVLANLSIQPLISFGQEIVAMGTRAKLMADQLGVGIEAAQEFSFAAREGGTSMSAIGSGMAQMNDRLAEGKDRTRSALAELRLGIGNLRAQKPEDAFTTIADAIGKVPDPMRQTHLAMELFGDSGARILPVIREGFGRLREEAKRTGEVIGEDGVRSLDEFQRRSDAFFSRFKVAAAEAALSSADAFKQSFSTIASDVLSGVWASVKSGGDPFQGAAAGLFISGARTRSEGKDSINEIMRANNERAARVNAALGVGMPLKPSREEEAALRERAAAAKRYAAEVQAALDKATGTAAQRNVRLLQDAFNGLTADQRVNADIVRKLLAPYETLRQQIKTLPSELERVRSDIQKPLPARNLFETTRTEIVQTGNTIREVTTSLPKIVALPGVANWATEARNNLQGLRKDGLLPVSQSFAQVIPRATHLGDAFDTTGLKGRSLSNTVVGVREETINLGSSLAGVAQAFADLAQISGGALDGVAGRMAEVIGLMRVGAQVGQQFRSAFYDQNKPRFDKDGRQIVDATGKPITGGYDFSGLAGQGGAQNVMAAYGNLATTAIGGYGSMMAATDKKGRGARAASGAATGAMIGGSIVPGYGHAIGAAVGAIWGAARNPAFEDVMNRVGTQWGFQLGEGISEELARKIADDAKGLFKKDRATAEMFNFKNIVGELGGANSDNVKVLSDRFRDVFSFLDRGQLSVRQTRDVIDESWGAMATAATEKGGLLTAKMREMIDLNDRMKVGSKAIGDFVKQSLGSGLDNLTSALTIGDDARATVKSGEKNKGELEQKIGTLDKEAQQLAGKDGGPGNADKQRLEAIARERAEVQKSLTDLTSQLSQAQAVASLTAVSSQQSAGAAAAAIAGSFAMFQQQGMSVSEALAAVQPSVTALQAQLTATGYSGGAAFESLQAKIAFVSDAVSGPAVSAMQAWGNSIRDTYNGGVLTSEMFAGMASQITATRDGLIAQGKDGKAALELIKPQLQTIWELNQRMPGAIDEATQAMLAEAEAAGLVGDQFKSAQDRQTEAAERTADAVEGLATLFGVTLPSAAERGARRVADAIGTIPRDVDVNVNYDTSGMPSGVWNPNAPNWNPETGQYETPTGPVLTQVPGAAEGIFATGEKGVATWFGEGGSPEIGGPKWFMRDVVAGAMRDNGLASSAGGALDYDRLADAIARKIAGAFRDAPMTLQAELDGVPFVARVVQGVGRNEGGARTTMRGLMGLPVTSS